MILKRIDYRTKEVDVTYFDSYKEAVEYERKSIAKDLGTYIAERPFLRHSNTPEDSRIHFKSNRRDIVYRIK